VIKAVVITVSDSSYSGKREDTSGPAVERYLRDKGIEVTGVVVVPDEKEMIVEVLERFVEEGYDLVVTCGGTGLSPRDVTPEATLAVIEKEVPGFSELMRRRSGEKTPYAPFSRGVCGIAGKSLIINLPGSPSGAVENLDFIAHLIPDAVRAVRGDASENS